MTPDDFDKLQMLMSTRAGYRLKRDRMQLAEHRLGPIARREGYANVEALLTNLWAHPVASLGWGVIEALLNPETWFRRDRAPFRVFERELLPALAYARPSGQVRVWSAGCSTGQEAWSIAMAGLETGARIEVVGERRCTQFGRRLNRVDVQTNTCCQSRREERWTVRTSKKHTDFAGCNRTLRCSQHEQCASM